MVIKDLCCEYCLNSMIDELLITSGIEQEYTNFDYRHKQNVFIYIIYDDTKITLDQIKKLEEKFN